MLTCALSASLLTPTTLLSGCKNGPSLSLNYGQTARENYELALAEFVSKDWEEAVRYADFVRIRFPFSRFAVEAELLVARAQFEGGEYLIAKDSFKQFTKLHPTHRHVRNGWANYMVAVSAFMAAPTDSFFLMPKHYELDQSILEDALVELDYFFDHYPDSPLVKPARGVQEDVQRALLEHELYVARFYLDRERPEAAIGRLEVARTRYPDVGFSADILFLLGLTYLRVEEIELARGTFTELQTQHPDHHHGEQARIYLKYIYESFGPADPNRARPDRSRPVPIRPPRPKAEEVPGAKRRAKVEARRTQRAIKRQQKEADRGASG